MLLKTTLISFLLLGCSHQATNPQEYKAIAWAQTSGEFKALSYQAFNIAKYKIDERLKIRKKDKPLAIIVDADETILDNGPYHRRVMLNGKGFKNDTWLEWEKEGTTPAMPGAVEFINYIAKKGVTTFYVSNRSISNITHTIQNMKELGFPVSPKQVMLKENSSNKKSRQDQIIKNYEVVLLMGDTLADFSPIFYKKETKERNKLVNQFAKEFGDKFIIFPNPLYGEWEGALYKYNYKLTDKEKIKMIREQLKEKL